MQLLIMEQSERLRFEAKAKILKAMAHPSRLWMLEQLKEGERCVCEFVDSLEVDFSTVSKHLSVLKQAGIVEVEKRGKQVFYTMKTPCVMQFMSCVEAVILSEAEAQMDLVQ